MKEEEGEEEKEEEKEEKERLNQRTTLRGSGTTKSFFTNKAIQTLVKTYKSTHMQSSPKVHKYLNSNHKNKHILSLINFKSNSNTKLKQTILTCTITITFKTTHTNAKTPQIKHIVSFKSTVLKRQRAKSGLILK